MKNRKIVSNRDWTQVRDSSHRYGNAWSAFRQGLVPIGIIELYDKSFGTKILRTGFWFKVTQIIGWWTGWLAAICGVFFPLMLVNAVNKEQSQESHMLSAQLCWIFGLGFLGFFACYWCNGMLRRPLRKKIQAFKEFFYEFWQLCSFPWLQGFFKRSADATVATLPSQIIRYAFIATMRHKALQIRIRELNDRSDDASGQREMMGDAASIGNQLGVGLGWAEYFDAVESEAQEQSFSAFDPAI